MVSRDGAFRRQPSPEEGSVDEAHRTGAQRRPGAIGGAPVDETHPIVALAARQHGVVTTAQLVAAGVGRRSIARRVDAGWLVPLHRGVYQVGPVAARHGREMAALLACGPRAALSHQSAAAIWGFAQRGDVVHVTVEGHARRPHRGTRVHRTHSLDAVAHHGMSLTSPARTLSDLRRTLGPTELERAREQAQILGLVIPDGASLGEGFTRSEAERRLKALCKAARLPAPIMNARVAGYEVDALWPAQRLVVEIDGWAYHRTRAAFERDRRRDAALVAAGYRVVRITWRRLTTEPYAVSAQLGALLQEQRLSA